MQTTLLWAAAVMSVVTFAIHTFIGGPRVAAPLLADTNLPKASKWLNYYCWHITTIYTFVMGGAYAYVAMRPEQIELLIGTIEPGNVGVKSITLPKVDVETAFSAGLFVGPT